SMSIGVFRAPLKVTGTFASPDVMPDPAVVGAKAAASVALGIVATPLGALIPTIELGLGKDSDCNGLIQQAKQAVPAPPVNKPAGARLSVPTRGLAEAIAAEWSAQGEEIVPATMPLMQLAATALDRVAPARARTVDQLVRYGETDLLCYRADAPPDLVER